MLDTSSSYSDDLFEVWTELMVVRVNTSKLLHIGQKLWSFLKPQSLFRVEGTAHTRVRWDSREIIATVDFLPRKLQKTICDIKITKWI